MAPFRTMKLTSPETKAFRQMLGVGAVSFFVGFFAVFALIAWLIAHFIVPGDRWWEILHAGVNAILISVLGGLCFAFVTTSVLSKIQYMRGVYRCPHCGKPLKRAAIPCDCPEAKRLFGGVRDA